jgi:hypothetical protein
MFAHCPIVLGIVIVCNAKVNPMNKVGMIVLVVSKIVLGDHTTKNGSRL